MASVMTGAKQSEKMKLLLTGHLFLHLPAAPAAALLAATNITTLTQETAMTTKQIAHAVNITVTIVDTTASLTGGTFTLVGRDQDGKPVSEVFTYTAAGAYTGNVAFSYVERIIFALTGTFTGAGDETVAVATATKIGLPVGQDGELVSVWKDVHAGSIGTVGVYNRTYGTIIPASAPNADHTQEFYYTYKVKLP
jgi:hypothetical protein